MKKTGILTWLLLFSGTVCAEEVYSIARAPQLSYLTTSKTWAPFAEYLERETGYKFRLKVYYDRTSFEDDVRQAKPDFFYGNSGCFIVGKIKYGYVPLIHNGNQGSKGIVVVTEDSDIISITQLNGKTITFPDEHAFIASLYIQSLLKAQSLKFNPAYVNGHDNVYRSVAAKRFVAGGGVHKTLDGDSPSLRNKLRVIYETPVIAPHLLTAHPRIPQKVREAVVKLILAMPGNEEGRAILRSININEPVKAEFTSNYQSIEHLATVMYSSLLND